MGEPIRIAQILNKMDSGGIEAVVMNYYRNINRSKIQFDFYFAEDSEFPQKEELKKMGAGIYPIPVYTKVVAYHKVLYHAFRERKYHIVHAHLSTMSIFALFAAWRAKVPVRICHNHSTAEKGEGKRTILKYVLRPWNRLFATHYFACGDKAARWMYGDKRVDSGRVTILPNAIDVRKYAFDEKARIRLRVELGIPQDAFVVGHVGRFMYQKNHSKLVHIFQSIVENNQEINSYLLLIGEGELVDEIKDRGADFANRVKFTGARKDVNELYSVMDVFCLPSFYEGMPVVAWEAQANGLPCVFSDNVSQEAKILDYSCFMDIDKSDEEWADMLLKYRNNVRNKEPYDCVPDILTYAGTLEEFYLNGQKSKL